MMVVFSKFIDEIVEVFMDDFSVYGKTFMDCLANLETVEQLPPPTDVKSLRSFLGHAGFYRRFIKDFSKITKPLTHLLQKDVAFDFDEKSLAAFQTLKSVLVSAPIIQPPDWSQPFEIMCDASDYAVGAVLGQTKEGRVHTIYYTSKTEGPIRRTREGGVNGSR
jgi:hypothetical protein